MIPPAATVPVKDADSERAVVLLVHGVGPFDAVRQEGAARGIISRALPQAEVEVQSYDWRAEVGGAIRRTRLDPAALGSLGASWHAIALDRLMPDVRSLFSRRLAAAVITLYHFAATFLPLLLLGFWLAGGLQPSAEVKTSSGKSQALLDLKRRIDQVGRLIEARHQGRPIPPVLLDRRRLRDTPDPPAMRPWALVRQGAVMATLFLFAAVAAIQFVRRSGSRAGRLLGLAVPWIWSAMSSLLIFPYLLVQAGRRSEVKSQGWILGIALGGILGALSFRSDRYQGWILVAALCSVPIGFYFGPRLVRWAAGRALRLLQTPVGLALMLISDVVRYLGDAQYRRGLQDHLGERLRSLLAAQPPDLVIAAHSLGSVIAVDTLLRRAQIVPPRTRVTLLTMGSPLKRTFHRFFPDRYADPIELRTELNARVGPLRWINVHRPFDPVGTNLLGSLPADRVAGKLRWTWPFLLFFPAHTDYWGDAVVLDQALQGIRALPFVAGVPSPTASFALAPDPPPDRPHDGRAIASELLALGSSVAIGMAVHRSTFAEIGDGKALALALVFTLVGFLYLYVFSPYFGIVLGYIPGRRTETVIEIQRPLDASEPPEGKPSPEP